MMYIANWKMNIGYKEAQNFLFKFKNFLKEGEKEKFIFLPPAFLSGLFHQEKFYWGAQNVSSVNKGAFTGENSVDVIQEMGAQFCLLGHSERRYTFGETDADVEKKFDLIQKMNLIPILCVGELSHERRDKQSVFRRQLSWIKTYDKYQKLPWKPENRPESFREIPLIVAYEPVWAIGTGETPSPEEVNESHHFIKEYLQFENIPVFYGGSVTKENVFSLSQNKYMDGFLIGGASLKAEEFYSIYERSKN